MMTSAIVRLVETSTRRPWLVLLIAIVITLAGGLFAARNFAINTNTGDLISDKLPWRQRQLAFDKTFPQLYQRIIVVLDADTIERADTAAQKLTDALAKRKDVVSAIDRPDALPFFRRNGLLFKDVPEVEATVRNAANAVPLLVALTHDPSLRGLTMSLGLVGRGVQRGAIQLDTYASAFQSFATAFEQGLDNKPIHFSWQPLLSGKPTDPTELRRFITVKPVLDYASLQPGQKTSEAIRAAARDLGIDPAHGYRVRLTGDVPLADEEFATVAEGAEFTHIGTVLVVALLMWLALRSPKIVVAILISVGIGLVITAAAGLMLVGAFNLISIAFAVLFVGIGADFGIQFAVRYRAERHREPDLKSALILAGARAGRPLALAAAATALGFLAFLPTVYRGVSELGLIAGLGMIIAFFTSVTVLPALLVLMKPPGEGDEIGYRFLAPVDRFLARQRWPIIIGTLAVVLAGTPQLTKLQFDFNPLNLRSDKAESVSTLKDLMKDPNSTYNAVEVLAPDTTAAGSLMQRLQQLPEVQRAISLPSFVPQDQERKLAIIALAKPGLAQLDQPPEAAPSDAEEVAALRAGRANLTAIAGSGTGPGAQALRKLGEDMSRLADGTQAQRAAVRDAILDPFRVTVAGLQQAFQAGPVTLEGLPPELKREWVAEDGRTRIEVTPKGDPNDNALLKRFTEAVQKLAPDATGAPIAIQGAGDAIVSAFVEAGAWALFSISILLFIVLRRIMDVLLTLVPLILAGMVTLEICVLIGMPLNFANIIALPLLLGLGVAFKIYFVMAWRAGVVNLLQSSLTRAVFFSAMTTATAFGSLWLSNHPGTSSMGKLLALSLVCTLAAAVLFQPALMGPPRAKEGEEVN